MYLMIFKVKMCFQRIAADVLGIRLTKNELEKTNVSYVKFVKWLCNFINHP